MWLKRRVFMNEIIPISLLYIGLLVTNPFAANTLGTQEVSLNLDRETNVLPAQNRPPYAIGYTVHYRSPRVGGASPLENRKWTLEGFHLERRDAESAARRLQRLGFRTEIRSRAAAERRSGGGR
jgi:hypothetical protein